MFKGGSGTGLVPCVMVVRADSEASGICVFSHEALNQVVPECYRIVTPEEEGKRFTAWLGSGKTDAPTLRKEMSNIDRGCP